MYAAPPVAKEKEKQWLLEKNTKHLGLCTCWTDRHLWGQGIQKSAIDRRRWYWHPTHGFVMYRHRSGPYEQTHCAL